MHALALHEPASSVLPHALPPFFGETFTACFRVRMPPPHDAEHLPHGPHEPSTHATAQSVESSSSGHARPSGEGGVTIGRVRSFRPVAASHCAHADHSATSQCACAFVRASARVRVLCCFPCVCVCVCLCVTVICS